jgi:hypothetical protein
MAIPFGLKFSGYARYGAQFQTGDQKYVGVDGLMSAPRRSAVWATKATAANSRSARLQTAQGLSGIST